MLTFGGAFFGGIGSRAGEEAVNAIFSDPFLKSAGLDKDLVPWILLEQVNYDQQGRAVIYSKDYHHSEYITFHVLRYRSS